MVVVAYFFSLFDDMSWFMALLPLVHGFTRVKISSDSPPRYRRTRNPLSLLWIRRIFGNALTAKMRLGDPLVAQKEGPL